ncbi:MAG: hypothetical protein Q8O35_03815 [Humidesulfovibrio sp.]|jgi:hypothetical protein|uniref:hypothetical protein n=1 Tax=Humidesulfovibrio sp. TaxID=2910988 RepID=UPI002734B294|nr:hypothetical protein [Humidesulfovibrio sp.]MDP2847300.1 hypothetical protein [Humidesulfovibrio sp.]
MIRSKAVLRLLFTLCLPLFLASCASQKTASIAAAQQEVQFLDSGSFDRKLSSALSADQPQVTVVFPAAITLNNIPERLDKWLGKVEKFGGTVEIQAEPEASRGLISEIFGLFIKAYDAIEEAVIYSSAKHYNVMIYYKAQTGLVTRVCFVRKPAGLKPAESSSAVSAPEPAPEPAPEK